MCPLKFCCAEINALFSSTGFQNEGFIFSTNKLFKAVYTSYWTSDHLKSRGIGPMDNFDLPHFFLSNYLLLVSVV